MRLDELIAELIGIRDSHPEAAHWPVHFCDFACKESPVGRAEGYPSIGEVELTIS